MSGGVGGHHVRIVTSTERNSQENNLHYFRRLVPSLGWVSNLHTSSKGEANIEQSVFNIDMSKIYILRILNHEGLLNLGKVATQLSKWAVLAFCFNRMANLLLLALAFVKSESKIPFFNENFVSYEYNYWFQLWFLKYAIMYIVSCHANVTLSCCNFIIW